MTDPLTAGDEAVAAAGPPGPARAGRSGRAPRPKGAGRPVALVAALALAVAGTVVLVRPGGSSGVEMAVIGGNLPVNAGALSRLNVEAHNSPALAASPTDPADLAVASRIDAPAFGCGLHVSADGGATWAQNPVPPIEGAGSVAGCLAPDATFGADGSIHVAFSSIGPVAGRGVVPDGIWVASAGGAGSALARPVRAAGPLAFNVRVLADRARPGRLWLAWVQASATSAWGLAGEPAPVVVARSDNGGRTWADPVTVSPPRRLRVAAPALATTADGALLVAYLDLGDDRLDHGGAHEGRGGPPYAGPWALVVARSDDAGASWQETVVDPGVVPTQRFLMLFPPAPSIAAGPDDRVHVGFTDGRWGDADVAVWTSTTGGRSWGGARRVSTSRPGDGRSEYLPALAVSPGGRLDVVYYDRRADPDDRRNEVSFQTSTDGGRSFSDRVVLSEQPFDSTVGFGAERGLPELGSRLGLVSTAGGALAVWADTRAGDHLSVKQDLARAVVSIDAARPAPTAARVAGVGLLAAAAATLVLAARRRPRPAASTPGGTEPPGQRTAAPPGPTA